MAEQTGWAEDRTQPPHLLLSTPLGTLRPESVIPAVANGREVVVFAGSDEESLPVRFVDLDSGALLPDRSLLHSAHLVGLGMGSGRALLATATLRGTVAVREVGTGEPIGPAIHGPGSPLAVLTGLVGPRSLSRSPTGKRSGSGTRLPVRRSRCRDSAGPRSSCTRGGCWRLPTGGCVMC